MRRFSIIAQVGIASAFFFAVFAIVLSQLVTRAVSQNFTDQTVSLTQQFLEKEVDIFLNPSDFEKGSMEAKNAAFQPFVEALSGEDVLEVIIWDSEGRALYAFDKNKNAIDTSLVNESAAETEEFQKSISGEPLAITQAASGAGTRYTQIFIPVYLRGVETPVGVVQVYYGLSKLDTALAAITRTLLAITAVTFLLLYLILLLITKRADSTIKSQEEKIESAHMREVAHGKELLKLKDQFFFVATHDLKTPVTAITGTIDMIKEESQNIPPELSEEMVIIEEASARLNNLVEDLLEVARSDSGTIKLNPTALSLKQMTEKAIRQVSNPAKKRGVSLNQNVPDMNLLADEAKFNEILENLLSNAVKYNKNSGSVTISGRDMGNMAELSVKDTGLGIPQEEQPKVFSKFFRSETEAVRDLPGTGLGLFVVKMLVEKMGGTISFSSTPGAGTEFKFTVPKAGGN